MTVPGFVMTAPSVLEADSDPVVVTPAQIAGVATAAGRQPSGRARLLLHPDRDDALHEMVIALPAGSCDHPHINDRSGKSFAALGGRFAVMCFAEDGTAVTPIVLSVAGETAAGDPEGRPPGAAIVRLRRPTWHTIIPLGGDVVFLETVAGPFRGNRFARWFPDAGTPAHSAAVADLRRIARIEAVRLLQEIAGGATGAAYSKKTYSWSPV